MPTPAVVFSLGFEYKWRVGDHDYLDYMSRPEAFKKEQHRNDEYKDFLEYMSNSEKSDGLFDAYNDHLSEQDKDAYRELEIDSLKEGCPKYFGVISFDNEFLEKHGVLYNGHLRSELLKNYARKSISVLIDRSKKLDNDNVYWNAAIHTNTDNIHIHYSLCEYSRRCDRVRQFRDGDCIEVEAFDALKSKMANSIAGSKKAQEMTQYLRECILPGVKESLPAVKQQLLLLAEQLPEGEGLQYNQPKMRKYQPIVNDTIDAIVSSSPFLSQTVKEYTAKLDEMTEYYREFYGEGERHLYLRYKKNSLEDFYSRAGNIILKEIKNSKLRELVHAHPEVTLLDELEEVEKKKIREQPIHHNEISSYADTHNENAPLPSPAATIYPNTKNESIDVELLTRRATDLDYRSDAYRQARKLVYQHKYADADQLFCRDAINGNIMSVFQMAQLRDKEQITDDISADDLYKIVLKHLPNHLNSKYADSINYRLGNMHEKGKGTDVDYEKAAKYYADAGDNAYAQYNLANLYRDGNGVDQNSDKALELYISAADKHHAYAAYTCGKHFADSNHELSEHYYSIALNEFLAECSSENEKTSNFYSRIGNMYERGLGTTSDLNKAAHFYELADDAHSNYRLGVIYKDQPELAEHYLRRSIDMDDKNSYAWLRLGLVQLHNGQKETARNSFRQAAALGNEFAHNLLIHRNYVSQKSDYLAHRSNIVNTTTRVIGSISRELDQHTRQLIRQFEAEQAHLSEQKKETNERYNQYLYERGY